MAGVSAQSEATTVTVCRHRRTLLDYFGEPETKLRRLNSNGDNFDDSVPHRHPEDPEEEKKEDEPMEESELDNEKTDIGSAEEESEKELSKMPREGDKILEVPNDKDGVLKASYSIKPTLKNVYAKIRIVCDTVEVVLSGTRGSINCAENLIKELIAEADRKGSSSLVARAFSTVQAAQDEVPFEKDGVRIGEAKYSIKLLCEDSLLADIEIVSVAGKLRLTGTLESIKWAERLIKGVDAEADAAGGSPSLVDRLYGAVQPASGVPQIHPEEEKKEDEPKEESELEPEVPNDKDGVLTGEVWHSIQPMRDNSSAKIQIGRGTVKVELFGTLKSINCAENLIKADRKGSSSLVARAFSTVQAAQDEVPFEKDGVQIGEAKYSIKLLWDDSPLAKIKIVSVAGRLDLTGTLESIKWAERLIKGVDAEADAAGGSPSLVDRLYGAVHPASGVPQIHPEKEKKEDEPKEESELEPEVPNDKDGVQTGEVWHFIQPMRENSSAKIQIGRGTVEVELFGTLESINCAENLIKELIAEAEADRKGSSSLVARAFSTVQAAQDEVPFEKDGVRIGKAKYSIEFLWDDSPLAKIQIVSVAGKLELIGTLESIKWAERLIKDVDAEADAAGGSPSLVDRLFGAVQPASAGKARYAIEYLPSISLAQIQIVVDVDEVQLFGTLESIKRAQKLIEEVIAEADRKGSPSLVARAFSTVQAASGGVQDEILVPFEKDGVRIGKAKYSIEFLWDDSPLAKIQIVSVAGKLELIGTLESIKWAERLIKDVDAEADAAGGSPSLVDRLFGTVQPASAVPQIHPEEEKKEDEPKEESELEPEVPNDKVNQLLKFTLGSE